MAFTIPHYRVDVGPLRSTRIAPEIISAFETYDSFWRETTIDTCVVKAVRDMLPKKIDVRKLNKSLI